MKREIKFRYRVKQLSSGRTIIYEKTLEEVEVGLIVLNHIDLQILSRDRFTGLKDKGGKDVFEGDMLQFSNGRGTLKQPQNVVFEDGAFRLTPCGIPVTEWNIKTAEIISNENPDLLA